MRVKLGDFGLAKDVGTDNVYRSGDPENLLLPVAWTAPEAFNGEFSNKSDVWAMGVVIWEVFSWGSIPFGICSGHEICSDHQCPLTVFSHNEVEYHVCVMRKTLLSSPPPCVASFCDSLKALMAICWAYKPADRPRFTQLLKFVSGAAGSLCLTTIQKPEDRLGGNDLDHSEICATIEKEGMDKKKSLPAAYAGISAAQPFQQSAMLASTAVANKETGTVTTEKKGIDKVKALVPAYAGIGPAHPFQQSAMLASTAVANKETGNENGNGRMVKAKRPEEGELVKASEVQVIQCSTVSSGKEELQKGSIELLDRGVSDAKPSKKIVETNIAAEKVIF